jgi:hypothetical protein
MSFLVLLRVMAIWTAVGLVVGPLIGQRLRVVSAVDRCTGD